MSVHLINDWKYLFNTNAIGGRFASFTFIHLAYMHTGAKDLPIDGVTIILFGLGMRIAS